MRDSMNIYAKPGTKVYGLFDDDGKCHNGYDSDKVRVEMYLDPKTAYTVEHTEVSQSSTAVYLQEFPRLCFNSVCLTEVAILSLEEEKTPTENMIEHIKQEVNSAMSYTEGSDIQEVVVKEVVEENQVIQDVWNKHFAGSLHHSKTVPVDIHNFVKDVIYAVSVDPCEFAEWTHKRFRSIGLFSDGIKYAKKEENGARVGMYSMVDMKELFLKHKEQMK